MLTWENRTLAGILHGNEHHVLQVRILLVYKQCYGYFLCLWGLYINSVKVLTSEMLIQVGHLQKKKKNYLCKLSKRENTIVFLQYSKSSKSRRWIASYIKIHAMMEGKLFRKQFNVLPPHYENDLYHPFVAILHHLCPKEKKNMSLRGKSITGNIESLYYHGCAVIF